MRGSEARLNKLEKLIPTKDTQKFPGYCILYDDEEDIRDSEGRFVRPARLAGTHPNEYCPGWNGETIVMTWHSEFRDI